MGVGLFTEITLYALADSVNPCAIAILAMILMTILIHNPNNKRKVFYSGMAFVLAVFVGYFFYSVILYQLFKTSAAFLAVNSSKFKLFFGIFAIILGALSIKDYFYYRKGGFATEMPMSFRPRVKKIISKITSPLGAFIIGFFVTLFLLPCTAGPLLLASGSLSKFSFIVALPWFLYYNFLFVLPMLIIVILVSFSLRQVEEISGWQKKNIKKLHLISGLLLFFVGLALIVGWL